MANLIITIISIALVAVAAIMGAYYGGQAFQEGQAKARANKVISDAEQVASALRLWSLENAGSRTLPVTGTALRTEWQAGTPTEIVPKYIGELPRYPGIGPSNNPYLFPLSKTEGAWVGGIDVDLIVANSSSIDYATCLEVAKMARGSNAAPIFRSPTTIGKNGDFSSYIANQRFDCIVNDTNATGAFESTSTDRVVIYFRVF